MDFFFLKTENVELCKNELLKLCVKIQFQQDIMNVKGSK